MFIYEHASIDSLLSNWWLLIIRGLAAVALGIITFSTPGVALFAFLSLIGIYMVWDGLFAFMLTAIAARDRMRWWPFLLQGIAGVGAGLATFVWPGVTALVLLYILAGWSIVVGTFQVVAAIRLREIVEDEWLLALSGVISVGFGLLLVARPGDGVLGLLWLIAMYALVFGIIQIAVAFRIRGWSQRYHATHVAV